VGAAGTIQAPFTVDAYGRVTGVPTTAAGIIENLSGTEVVNPSSYIKYLKRPIQVLSIASNTTTTTTITVSPTIFPTVGSASATLPSNAKTVLLESTLTLGNNNQTGLVCSALNSGLLNTPTDTLVIGSNEYLINKASSKVYGGSTSTTQCMVPLSSNGSTLSFAVRISVKNLDGENGTLRIIGYTL